MVQRLGYHHVALKGVKNIDQTIEFYKKLGCSIVRQFGDVCMMDVGGNNIIEIFANSDTGAEENAHFEHVALRSADVDADYKAALDAGAESVKEPGHGDLNGLKIGVAFVRGLNGELIEFFQEM
jgi:glyoxylase I family protein